MSVVRWLTLCLLTPTLGKINQPPHTEAERGFVMRSRDLTSRLERDMQKAESGELRRERSTKQRERDVRRARRAVKAARRASRNS